mgnify:CR=1 FL=1
MGYEFWIGARYAGLAKGRVDVDFVVESDAEGVSETEETRFFGPF